MTDREDILQAARANPIAKEDKGCRVTAATINNPAETTTDDLHREKTEAAEDNHFHSS